MERSDPTFSLNQCPKHRPYHALLGYAPRQWPADGPVVRFIAPAAYRLPRSRRNYFKTSHGRCLRLALAGHIASPGRISELYRSSSGSPIPKYRDWGPLLVAGGQNSRRPASRRSVRQSLASLATVSGISISAVENFTFGREITPIAVAALLLLATFSAGLVGTKRPWLAAALVWFWIPAAHFVKHALGLRDTLHPNTYSSIAMLAAFSLFVCLMGVGGGAAIRRNISGLARIA
jgi:hypothetical protein